MKENRMNSTVTKHAVLLFGFESTATNHLRKATSPHLKKKYEEIKKNNFLAEYMNTLHAKLIEVLIISVSSSCFFLFFFPMEIWIIFLTLKPSQGNIGKAKIS